MDTNSYNYDEFIDTKFEKLMNFGNSIKLGQIPENYSFIDAVSRSAITLKDLCKKNPYTVIEFGSFT
jgi:hypothetical protein